MKKRLGFFILMILLLIGLSFCSKEEPISGDKAYTIGQAFFLVTDDVNTTTCVSAYSGGQIIENMGCDGSGPTTLGVCWSTTPNPKTADNITIADRIHPDPKHFHSVLTDLNSSTTYYVRAYATNSAGTVYGNEVSFTTLACLAIYNPDLNPDLSWGSVYDIDGNIYKTVKIGTQTWMAVNLKTARYNDGSHITDVIDNNMYGAYYTWYTVSTGKLCPTGWHVPSDDEWKQLEMELGMTKDQADGYWSIDDVDHEFYGLGGRGTDQGTQMKTTRGWGEWNGISSNNDGTNISGFSALPGGDTGGGVTDYCGTWWSSTNVICRSLASGDPGVIRCVIPMNCGCSIRCLKD